MHRAFGNEADVEKLINEVQNLSITSRDPAGNQSSPSHPGSGDAPDGLINRPTESPTSQNERQPGTEDERMETDELPVADASLPVGEPSHLPSVASYDQAGECTRQESELRLAVMYDSPPPCHAIHNLERYLKVLGFDVMVIEHLTRQRGWECGYRSIITALSCLSENHQLLQESDSPDYEDGMIALFNKFIENNGSDVIALNDIQIMKIMRDVEYFNTNFHLGPNAITTAIELYDLLTRMKVLCDSLEATSLQGSELLKDFVGTIIAITGKSKCGRYKSLLVQMQQLGYRLLKAGNENGLRQLRNIRDAAFANNHRLPRFFDGVMLFSEIHMRVLDRVLSSIRPPGLRSHAIVHNGNFHWFNLDLRRIISDVQPDPQKAIDG